MKELPQISEAELEVIKVIWSRSETTAKEIMTELSKTTDWKINTVKTLLGRLVKKGAIGFKQEKRTYYYYPLISENEYVSQESQSFLQRVFNGSVSLMMESFLKQQKLSQKDIDELKDLLHDKDSKG